MKFHVLTRLQKCLLTAGLLTIAASVAHATCGKYDNFSYSYPAYNANWTQDQCEAYAASGIGHCYSFGGDGGWGGAQEGVDCSAYCSRVWAIPGHISQTTTGAHPYSTYSWYPNDGSYPGVPHTHYVTVNSINDIQPYDCFVLNANYGNLGLHHMGLIESIDYAGGIIYTREANCSTQPTSGCDGPDGIHDNSWTYQSLVVGGLARIIRRNDWGATTNQSAVGPIAMNANGGLDMFGVGSDTAVWHDKQTNANSSWNGWTTLNQTGSTPGCAAAQNLDGRLEIYVVLASTKNVMRKYQTAVNGSWSSWASLGGTGTTNLQAVSNADGRIELFGVGTNGDIWHTWQTAANGGFVGSWYDRVGKKIKPGYCAAVNGDGRLELLGVASDGHVWHNWQTNAGAGWHGWADLGGTNMNPELAVARDADGRLEAFGIGSNGNVWVNFQTIVGGNYSGWYDLGGNGIKPGFVVGINATGRLEMFGVRGNNNLWHSAQITPGGSWMAWRDLGENGIDPQLVVANNADGRLEVFGVGPGKNIVSNFQLTPGGVWFGWLDMAGVGTKFYYGQ